MLRNSLVRQTQVLLGELRDTLHAAGLWSESPPPPQSHSSTVPFAADCLAFEQWLQFIFIPKMNELLSSKAELPSQIALSPMAEICWQDTHHTQAVTAVLVNIEQLLSGQQR